MKNKKGFTLVELLAVIAILAILVIIALPNVMGMFNKSKENTFITELKSIYRTAESQWISESMFNTEEKVYSRCRSGCNNSLDLNGREELEYYIKLDKSGKVVEFYATDGTYQFKHNGNLLLTNIQDVEKIADLGDGEVLTIFDGEVKEGNEVLAGGIPNPISFSTDSWETIQKAVKTNNISVYSVGDTKTVDLGEMGVHTVRIANKSTPYQCSNSDFSQTACGFVVEFSDIVTLHEMNPKTDEYIHGFTVGGWRDSLGRTYLNNEFYNLLPIDLKNVIIDTRVVSDHGTLDTSNFTTIDKIYLLSSREIYNIENEQYITASALTRQLDYYNRVKALSNGWQGLNYAKKPYNGSNYKWWLRGINISDPATSIYMFSMVNNYGASSGQASLNKNGISPAFRIG